MHARFMLAVFATCVPATFGVSSAVAQDRLPFPPLLEESLTWRADPEMVLQAFRVRPARGRAPRQQSAASVHHIPRTAAVTSGQPRVARGRLPRTSRLPATRTVSKSGQVSRRVRAGRTSSSWRYTAAAFPAAPGVRCLVSASFDRGQRWSEPVRLPSFRPPALCGTPALAYSPDGKHLYAAYQDQESTETLPDAGWLACPHRERYRRRRHALERRRADVDDGGPGARRRGPLRGLPLHACLPRWLRRDRLDPRELVRAAVARGGR